MTGQMKEESDAANAPSELARVTQSDRLTGAAAAAATAPAATAEREASATASLFRHVMQIGPARPAVLAEASGGQSKDMQAADRHYLLQANINSNGWREHASMLRVVVVVVFLQTNQREVLTTRPHPLI